MVRTDKEGTDRLETSGSHRRGMWLRRSKQTDGTSDKYEPRASSNNKAQ